MNRNTVPLRPDLVPALIIVIPSRGPRFAALILGMLCCRCFRGVRIFSLAVACINHGYARLKAVRLIAFFECINKASHLYLKFRKSNAHWHVKSPLEWIPV